MNETITLFDLLLPHLITKMDPDFINSHLHHFEEKNIKSIKDFVLKSFSG